MGDKIGKIILTSPTYVSGHKKKEGRGEREEQVRAW